MMEAHQKGQSHPQEQTILLSAGMTSSICTGIPPLRISVYADRCLDLVAQTGLNGSMTSGLTTHE